MRAITLIVVMSLGLALLACGDLTGPRARPGAGAPGTTDTLLSASGPAVVAAARQSNYAVAW